MRYTTRHTSSNGIGFVGLLTILFIGLKLTNYIDWPWIWVLSPIWIAALLGFIIVAVALLLYFLIKTR